MARAFARLPTLVRPPSTPCLPPLSRHSILRACRELCKALFAIGVEPTPATQRQYFAAATEALAAAAAADAVAAAGPDSTIEAEAAAAASALVSAADSIDLHSVSITVARR